MPVPAAAQAPLFLVNDETTVSEISFRFVEGQTFEASRLQEQIATQAPGFLARLRNRMDFLPGVRGRSFPFDPVTLQKDVARLRRFYKQNGFPRPQIDYPASQLDTTANSIHIIFTIREGPPLTIRETSFRTADGEAPITDRFDAPLRRDWTAFRTEATLQTGERYTEFKRTQMEADVRVWLRNRGFAFAEVDSEAEIDSTANAVALHLLIDPGPLATVSEILVEGNESVSKDVIRRELAFQVGDRFSAAKVKDGQRQLFDLNLFRVALADVPEQPRDSTVTVRYRVRETKLRSYSGQVGYGTQPGITLEGSWRHRNFQGDARNLLVGLIADTGYPQNPPAFFPDFLGRSATKDPNRRFRASVTLRQPYFLSERLSASLEPFAQERINQNIGANPDRLLGLSERQYGLNTRLVYDLLPFRSISLQHSYARIEQFRPSTGTDPSAPNGEDLFGRSVFSLSGTFGEADDFINPTRGYLIRPTFEAGIPPSQTGVDFFRASGELSGYLPLSEQVQLAGRVFGGMLWPVSESRTNLTRPSTAPDELRRRTRRFQDRFSEYLFYAGGGSDVRGWSSQLAGGKVLRESEVAREDYVYRPIGARSKLGVNLEMRLALPGLGTRWRAAAFVDAARVDAGALTLTPPPDSVNAVPGPDGEPVATTPSQLLVGTGLGARYETAFGFVRFDVAYKLTPDALDLRRPGDVGDRVDPADPSISPQPATAAPNRTIRRFRLHFGIGRSF